MAIQRYIYFIQPTNRDDEPIKIGHATLPSVRHMELQSLTPHPLRVLAYAPGDVLDESAIHRLFAEHRYRGEWFHPAPALLEFVREVKQTGKLPALVRTAKLPEGAQYLYEYTCHFDDLLKKHGWTEVDVAGSFGVTVNDVRAYRRHGLSGAKLLPFMRFAEARGVSLMPGDVFSVRDGAA